MKTLHMRGSEKAELGATVTFENADGFTLTLTDRGPVLEVLKELCDIATYADDSFRVVAISTPASIYSDLQGMKMHYQQAGYNVTASNHGKTNESSLLGRAGCASMIHPRMQ